MKNKPCNRFITFHISILCGVLFSIPICAADTSPNDAVEGIKSQVIQAELLREQGDLISAQQKLDIALTQAGKLSQQSQDYAAVELANGYNLLLLNRSELAEQRLKSAYAKTSGSPYLNALAQLYLAYWHLSNADNQQARAAINSGLQQLSSAEHEDLSLNLELLRAGLSDEPRVQQTDALLSIAKRLVNRPANLIKAKLSLKLVQHTLDLSHSDLFSPAIVELKQLSYQLLQQILGVGDDQMQPRIKADATGKLAQLYQLQNRPDEALLLTEQALNLAKDSQDHVLSAQLLAQLGELFIRQGDKERAKQAFSHAVEDLYAVRSDMPIHLPDGRSVLAYLIEPIYRRYVDLLLQSAGLADDENARPIVDKAINSMEAIKEADMQDFFLGRCSVSSANNTDWKQQSLPDTTVLYPILLPDRIELVVKSDNNLVRRIVKVPLEEVQTQTGILVEALHNGKDYRASSKQLYQWLIEPIKEHLQRAENKVLVFVPDRFLRAMPLSALNDGESFIVEQFAIVTLPSLAMHNAVREHGEKQARTLLAGLSKPDGAAIDQLPDYLLEKLSNEKMQREELIEELSLPSVEKEISTVAEQDKSTTLLNDQFTVSALKSDIETGQYNKVHIASHGYFGRNAKESFIMAYDQNLSLLDFKSSLEADSLKLEPIELLTLSACKTAEGDDRMLLGFSGLAVKSNVLSAVGSLWSINDDATMEFMKLFYDGLNRSLDKAQAMREAQMIMIKNKKFRHPFFWSPFILIGNWK